MKKISLFIFIMLLLIPFSVLAEELPSVKTLTAKANKSTINFNGTIEDGSHAVMCKLLNEKNEEIDLLSVAVSEEKFNGSFENVSNGTYNVACANYEGGEIEKIEVLVNESNNPKTSDSIFRYIMILLISSMGIFIGSVYLKKNRSL